MHSLPEEIIVEILKFLSPQDLRKNVKVLSKQFYRIANDKALQTIFDKALPFSKWQQEELNKLKNAWAGLQGQKEMKITILQSSPPLLHFLIIFALCIGTYIALLPAYKQDPFLGEPNFNYFPAILLLAMEITCVFLFGIKDKRDAYLVNHRQQIHLNDFIKKFPFMLNLKPFTINNNIRLNELVSDMAVNIKFMTQFAKKLHFYLKDKENSRQLFLDEEDMHNLTMIDKDLPKYTRNVSIFWHSTSRKSLVEINNVEERITPKLETS